jgi:O-antigen/teichoic acid export membrane protein
VAPPDGSASPDDRALDAQIVRGSGWVAMSYGARSVLSVLAMLALVRLVEPREFGLVALASIFVTVVEHLQAAGVQAALIYRRGDIRQAAASGLVFTAFTGIASAVALVLAAPAFAWAFHTPDLTNVVRVMVLVVAFRGLAAVPGAILERDLDFRSRAKAELAAGFVQIGLSIGLAVGGLGVWSLVLGQVGAAGVQAAILWLVVPWRPNPFEASWATIRELVGYGRFVSLGNILGLVNETVQNVAIGRLLGPAPLGYYGVTYRLADFPTSVIGYVVSRVMLPAYAAVQHDMVRFRRAFVQTLQRVALLSLPLTVGLAVGAEPIVRGLLGERWLPVVNPLRILALYSMVRLFASCAGAPFQALGKPHLVPIFALPQTVVTIPALIVLTPRYGVTGAAVSMVVGFSASGIPALIWAVRLVGLRAAEFVRALAPTLVCSAILAATLGALLLTRDYMGAAANLALFVVAGLAVYSAAIAVLARPAVQPIWTSVRALRGESAAPSLAEGLDLV